MSQSLPGQYPGQVFDIFAAAELLTITHIGLEQGGDIRDLLFRLIGNAYEQTQAHKTPAFLYLALIGAHKCIHADTCILPGRIISSA